MSLSANIVKFLQSQTTGVSPLQIAKAVGLKTAKDVNPTLYALQKQGLVKKEAQPDGSQPRWSAVAGGREIPPPTTALPALDKDILTLLGSATERLPPAVIAVNVLGPGSTAAMVNPSLYALQKMGLVDYRIAPDSVQRQWALVGKDLPCSLVIKRGDLS